MSESFGSSLQLTDLNDFVGPSQACIKPPPTPTNSKHSVSIGNEGVLIACVDYQSFISGQQRRRGADPGLNFTGRLPCLQVFLFDSTDTQWMYHVG